MEEKKLTVRDRIIIHLAGYTRFADAFECPEEMAQAGISASIGKSRAHTALELNRMKGLDLIIEKLAHVKGAKSKRKCYNLKPDAMAMEKEIVEHLRSMEIEVYNLEKSNILNGQQAVEIVIKELAISRTIAFDMVLSSDRNINIDEYKQEIEARKQSQDIKIREDNKTFDALILQANVLAKKGALSEGLAILDNAIKTEISSREIGRAHV